ncbi:MAG: ABC transporter permease [Candidatus Thalassarchaeaceae archaeon]
MKLHEFIARRVILLIPVMIGVSILTYSLLSLVPGDAAASACGDKCGVVVDTALEWNTTSEQWEEVSISAYESNVMRMGLDENLLEGYMVYVGIDGPYVGAEPLRLNSSGYLVPKTSLGEHTERNGLIDGYWGDSSLYHRPVAEVVKDFAPVTLEMSLLALLIAYPLGIFLGILSAVWQDQIFDQLSRLMAIAFVSLPIFWLAILFQKLFATKIGICDDLFGTSGGCFPIFGRHDPSVAFPTGDDQYVSWYPAGGTGFHLIDSWFVNDETLSLMGSDFDTRWELFKDTLLHLMLPCMTLGIASAGGLLRYMRASLLEVLREDYVRTARAKGLSGYRVIVVHACRNALVPIVTLLGFSIGGAIGGAVLTESIFAFTGMGRIAVEAIQYDDQVVVMGVTLITSVIFLMSNLIVDISYAIVDPRVRLE